MEDNQLYLMLGRLEGKVDAFLSKMETHEASVSNLEARVAKLEETKTQATGFVSGARAVWMVVAAAVGFLINTALKFLP